MRSLFAKFFLCMLLVPVLARGGGMLLSTLLGDPQPNTQAVLESVLPQYAESIGTAFDQGGPVLLVEVDQDLGIAPGPEPVSPGFEVPAQLPVVIDLAIEDDLDRAVLVADRLVASLEINDREAAMDQADAGLRPESLRIRAAMGDGVPQALQQPDIDRTTDIGVDNASDSAHRDEDPRASGRP